ncbi:hypothetical protein F4604DRAFT_1674299 [Suillus subluteus]|nr:hypothetical protein F4604DRAFT_1674299 [Suillus subluteus]
MFDQLAKAEAEVIVSDIIGALQNTIPDLETQYPVSNTNYSAFKLDYQNISTIITKRQQQLDTVSHEISRFETVIDGIYHIHQQLVAKKDKITQSMNSHKRLVSALWRLPAEILSQIFVHCLPIGYRLSPALEAGPTLLTKICRRWREIAVDMPDLWQELYVGTDWQRAAFCYETWLKRSRGRPLSLELESHRNNWTELRSLLQPYINQVSSLSLHFYPNGFQPEFMPPCTLRSLTVIGPFFNMEYASTFNPAWARLTDIQIELDEPNAFPQLLRLGAIHAHPTHSDNVYDGDTEHLHLFDTPSLPNLRVLETRGIYPWPHEEFKAFLTRSKCPLESLTFGFEESIKDHQRAEYVALIPSLKEVLVVR